MLVFLTWAFEVVAATAIGGMVTGAALVAGLFVWAHTPRAADIGPSISAPLLAGEETKRADAG
ncbi:MAG TPA: hypothetical protein VG735_09845 [Caulobacterales bacterium]|jgi:hypothetical protein|nr:hypothetical protein [Caulobacterales bacterium]